jgi:hypothetical protein
MKVSRKMSLIATLFLILNMVIATQYAVTKIDYEYTLVHPCDASIRYIGSDNSSDGKRVMRIAGSNTSNIKLKLSFGNVYTTNMKKTFTAAFGIVNEENYSLNITHINVTSNNFTYMKIWLHGDRDANANNTLTDPSTVFMWDNDTIVNTSNTTAWTLREGNDNSSDMCYNVSNRSGTTIKTGWDKISHVRYSKNNSDAVSGLSDFVWVQVAIDIPDTADKIGAHTGTIIVYLESEG